MIFLYKLIKLGFLHPRTLLSLVKARKVHGQNLSFLLKVSADRFAKRIAITDGYTHISFKELYQKVLQLSFILQEKVQPDKSGIALLLCKNEPAHVILLYALQNIGLQTILMHHKTSKQDLQKIQASQTSPCYIFASDMPQEVEQKTWNIYELLAFLIPHKTPFFVSKQFGNIVFPTSGTTGTPKLIEKKRGAFFGIFPFIDLIWRTQILKRKNAYLSIPISHSLGYTTLLFAGILGKKLLLVENKTTEQVVQILLEEKIDVLIGVPSSLHTIAIKLKDIPHQISLIISSGAPLNSLIFDTIIQNVTKNICSLYGSTEANTSFLADYDALLENVCALGKPFKGIQYKLVLLATGGFELCVRSPLINIKTHEGWVHSGDLVAEAKGKLIWCCRKDDMILKNGLNIYPTEIEHELLRIKGISAVCVVGQQDLIKGQIICAYIVLKENTILTEADIQFFLSSRLASIKIPDKIYWLEKFDYTNTGKIIKPK